MLARLLLLFILVPIVELLLLLTLADLTGFWITVGLIVVTGVLGASLARHQGLRCWREVQQRMARGEVPADSLQDGLMILIAGAVLITPGVLTDLLGFALLMPPIRRFLKGYLAKRMKARIVMMSPTARREEPSEKTPHPHERMKEEGLTDRLSKDAIRPQSSRLRASKLPL